MNPMKIFAIGLVCSVGGLASGPTAAATGAANDHTVLILNPTVTGGGASTEAQSAIAAGMDVEVVDDAGWAAKSQTDFATYRALILGDPTCVEGAGPIAAAEANRTVWGPVVNGNVVLIGTDPVYHLGQGGAALTDKALRFVVTETNQTGLYLALSCYYHETTGRAISFL